MDRTTAPRVQYEEMMRQLQGKRPASLYMNLSDAFMTPEEPVVMMRDCNDKAAEIYTHQHTFHEVLIIEQGEIRYQIEDRVYRIGRGDVIVLPAGYRHHPIFTQESLLPYQRIVIWIHAGYLAEEVGRFPELGTLLDCCHQKDEYVWHPSAGTAGSIMQTAHAILENTKQKPYGWYPIQHYGCMSLLAILGNYIFSEGNSGMDAAQVATNGMLSYVHAHWREKITLDDLARALLCSRAGAAKKFRETVGIPFYEYVTQLRLLEITKRMQAGTPITQAWIDCGFADYSSFYRAFKKNYGTSPSEFMKLHDSMQHPSR